MSIKSILPLADKDNMVTLVAVGDVTPEYEHADKQFDLTRPILKGADITFGQLESTLSLRGTRQLGSTPPNEPSRAPSGPVRPLAGDPRLGGKILSDAGFNIMSFASNHTMGRSEDGMLDTLNVLKDNNIVVIGCGKNIEEATRPAIIERKGIKVGFLAYCSVVPRGQWATANRSGVAPVRASTAYEQFDWQAGTPPRIFTKAYPDDLAGMVEDIKKLRPQVDVLVVSHHWGIHFVPALIAMYQYEVGHAAIDAGADLIIGHHAHILKGIEVYKGKVIFFSLANFKMRFSASMLPSDTGGRYVTQSGYRYEIDPDHPGFAFPIDSIKTILVKCNIANKKIRRVAFLPLWINNDSYPEPLSCSDPRSDKVYRYMEWLCGDQGLDTKFSREGDEVVVLA